MKGLRWIQAYYLASPLFFLVGVWWGFEIRVTFLPNPGHRFLYYLVLSAFGLLAHYKPVAAPWLAMGESLVNLLLIILWIMLPIYALADGPLGTDPVGVPYTPAQVLLNGLLAGGFFLLGFYRAQGIVIERFPWIGGGIQRGPGNR